MGEVATTSDCATDISSTSQHSSIEDSELSTSQRSSMDDDSELSTSQHSSVDDDELNTSACSDVDSVVSYHHCTASNNDNSNMYSSIDDKIALDSSDEMPSDSNDEISLDCNDNELSNSITENSTAPVSFDHQFSIALLSLMDKHSLSYSCVTNLLKLTEISETESCVVFIQQILDTCCNLSNNDWNILSYLIVKNVLQHILHIHIMKCIFK